MDAFYSLEEQEKIILENQKLVYYLVKKFNVVPDNYEDFVSVGTIGLIKAVATFDASKDIKFATYAARCIENEILMYMRKEKKHSRETSLEAPLNVDSEGNQLTLRDLIAHPGDFTDEITSSDLFEKLINIVLNCLSPKERLVMLYRISNVKQSEIAKMANISQSYISRLERKLCKKIKSYLYGNVEYKEIFKMNKAGDTYKISFSSKDVKQFNKALESVLKDTTDTKSLPNFKVVNEDGRIKIWIPAYPEAFIFVAKIIQELDNYSIMFISNKKK